MDARVPATITLHLAKADLKVAELEALEQSTPNLRSNSNQRIVIARRLRAARDLRNGWERVLIAVGAYLQDDEDSIGLEREFKAAPERVVAQIAEVVDQPNTIYCNRQLCYWTARTPLIRLVPVISSDLPDGAICFHCGRVLSS